MAGIRGVSDRRPEQFILGSIPFVVLILPNTERPGNLLGGMTNRDRPSAEGGSRELPYKLSKAPTTNVPYSFITVSVARGHAAFARRRKARAIRARMIVGKVGVRGDRCSRSPG
jgi:hypothetical protein